MLKLRTLHVSKFRNLFSSTSSRQCGTLTRRIKDQVNDSCQQKVQKLSCKLYASTTTNIKTHIVDTTGLNITNLSVTENGKKLDIEWEDGKSSSFHSVWLRFNCPCPKCKDPYINVGVLTYHEIPLDLTIKDVKISDDGLVTVTYLEDEHKAAFPTKFLKEMCYSKESLNKRREAMKPVFYLKDPIPEVEYSDLLDSDYGLYKWLRHINEHGLSLLRQVPTTPGMLKSVIEKIGSIQETLFGGMYELYVKDEPIDLAYSSAGLQTHTDLPCYESPPGIQFLHCLKYSDTIKGGETVFIDLVHTAELFRQEHPEEFKTLTTVPCSYERIMSCRGQFVHLEQRRPPIELNSDGEIISIRWSPTYLGIPYLDEELVEPFYKAFQLFARAVHNYPYKKLVRWKIGDLIGFNNRRMAHGRNPINISSGERHLQKLVRWKIGDLIGFNNRRMAHGRNPINISSGERHLQGGYVNIDDYRSKLMVLAKQYGEDLPAKRVYNSIWS